MRSVVEGGFVEIKPPRMGVPYCVFEIDGHSGSLTVSKDTSLAEAEMKAREKISTAVAAGEALPRLIREMQAAEDAYAAAGKIDDMGTCEDALEDAHYAVAEIQTLIGSARRDAWIVSSPGWSHVDRKDDLRDDHEIPEWPLVNGRFDPEWMIGRIR